MQLLSYSRKMMLKVQSNAFRSLPKRLHAIQHQKSKFCSIISPLAALLQPNHSDIIRDEQNMLSSLLKCMRTIDASKEDIDLIYDTRARMDDIFLIVFVGEFNSGKSTLINSLLGQNLLKSGVIPTTNKICIVRHENDKSSQGTTWKQADNMLLGDVQEIKIDLQWLKNVAIVDTPGTNAIVADHELLTQQIIPRADLVLFVTSAERPMSDSESAVLSKICEWGKKVVMIVNKMDILSQPSEKEEVLDFVTQHAAKLLGDTVKLLPIFGVSGRLALNAKLLNSGGNKSWIGATAWEDSKFGTLEKYLTSVLGEEALIKCKLKNPLGVADRVITDSLNNLEIRKNTLEGDFRVLEMIEDYMVSYKKDLEREISLFRQNIKTLLQQLNDRCHKFLEQNITILKPSFLLNAEWIQEAFNREVLMDLEQPIDDIVLEMCTLISNKSKVQARAVIDFAGNRPKKHRESIVGSVNFASRDEALFDASKADLIGRIRRNIKAVLLTNNQAKNVVKMSKDVRTSLMQTAAVQSVSAVSIGAVASSGVAGVAGLLGTPGLILLGASGSMALGMFILPRKKELIRRDFCDRIATLQSQLDTVVLNDIEREVQSSDSRIQDSISPYSRFIDVEKTKVLSAIEALHDLRKKTRDIQNKLR